MPYPIVTDHDRRLWTEELRPALPDRLFDTHVHLVKPGSFPPGFNFPPRSCYQKFGGFAEKRTLEAVFAEMLPGLELFYACFGTPDPAADRSDAAAMETDNRHAFGLRLLSPDDSPELLDRDLRDHRLLGFKPYPDLAAACRGRPVPEITLNDFFSRAQLQYIDRHRLICVVHIPRPGRLADPLNQRQMVELCQSCPGGQFIFAHIGRAYWLRGITGQLDRLATCPNAWLDTAMVNHPEVLRYAFDHFPAERILFGSDAPIAFLHGKSVEINHQYAYLTGDDFNLGTTIHDANGAIDFAPFYYEQLRAALSLKLSQAQLENFLCNHALSLFTTTAQRLHP